MDLIVMHSKPEAAEILEDSKEKAILRNIGKGKFSLEQVGEKANQSWTLSNMVSEREMRPFSLASFPNGDLQHPTLEIKNHLFSHNGQVYSIGEALPIDSKARDHLSGAKFITRLVNFPFSQPEEVDGETRHRLKRHRGIPVGEFSGLGADGFDFKLYDDHELGEIALELAAATYVLYTTR